MNIITEILKANSVLLKDRRIARNNALKECFVEDMDAENAKELLENIRLGILCIQSRIRSRAYELNKQSEIMPNAEHFRFGMGDINRSMGVYLEMQGLGFHIYGEFDDGMLIENGKYQIQISVDVKFI